MSSDLGDVAVRARGLAGHLLSAADLERLARASGRSALRRGLEGFGYWPAPAEGATLRSTAEAIEAGIESEIMRRLDLLRAWLGERSRDFAGVFEESERRSVRIHLRRLAAAEAPAAAERPELAAPERTRRELSRATDLPGLVSALQRIRSPYAGALREALRTHGEDLMALETALDRAFAERARVAASSRGGRLLSWVIDGIDLDNAWSAILGQGEGFIAGGRRLSRDRHAAIAADGDGRRRRRELSRAFARSPLSRVFDDPEAPLATLESRGLRARIAEERRATRLDPIGAAPILEYVMRVQAEWADLRRIHWGIAGGLPAAAIAGQLVAAS